MQSTQTLPQSLPQQHANKSFKRKLQPPQEIVPQSNNEEARYLLSRNGSYVADSQANLPSCCARICLKMSRSARLVLAYFTAELFATFLLILIGDGAIATYVILRQPINIFVVCLAFGVGAMMANIVALRISGSHANPAVSLALALEGKLKWRMLPVYMVAQYLGAFLAAAVIYFNNIEGIKGVDKGIHSSSGSSNSTGQIFATYPNTYLSIWGALIDQTIGTAVFIFCLYAMADSQNLGVDKKHQPLYAALIVGLVCVAFNPNCGAIFNPARDLSPRFFTWLIGYDNPSVWAPLDGFYWLVAGVIGPHLGAILAVFGYRLLISPAIGVVQEAQFTAEKQPRYVVTDPSQQPQSTGNLS